MAVLESSTSALLGAPHGSGWSAPAITFLQRARLDPRVVYEVSIAARVGTVGAVYELSRGGETAFRQEGDKVVVPLEYATNDGRLLVFLPKKIGKVSLEVPDKVARGGVLPIRVNVADAEGASVPGLLPVEVRVFDARGREMDGAGWTSAENGIARLDVPLNVDDPVGAYTVWCRDRASGLTELKGVSVE